MILEGISQYRLLWRNMQIAFTCLVTPLWTEFKTCIESKDERTKGYTVWHTGLQLPQRDPAPVFVRLFGWVVNWLVGWFLFCSVLVLLLLFALCGFWFFFQILFCFGREVAREEGGFGAAMEMGGDRDTWCDIHKESTKVWRIKNVLKSKFKLK